MTKEPWPVGTEVAWYGPHDRMATEIARVEKVYKTGHMVIRGRRFRPFGPNSAYATGNGYAQAAVRLLTDANRAEIASSSKKRLAHDVANWLNRAAVADIPDTALNELASVMLATAGARHDPNA